MFPVTSEPLKLGGMTFIVFSQPMLKRFACYRVKPQFEEAEMLACKGISATRTIVAVNCISGGQGFPCEYVPVFLWNTYVLGESLCIGGKNVYKTPIFKRG